MGVNGHHLLISAAHVFDHLNDGPPLLIPGLQNFVPLNGLSKYLPPPPPKGRNFDPIDLGFVVVDPIIRELPYDSGFAAPSDLIASASHLPEYAYVVCGFAPNSVKRVFGKPILKGAPLFYTSACLPASFHNKRHTSPKTNLAIHFNKKKAFDRHNYLVQPPDPRGLSGSPILAMANAENSYGGHLHIFGVWIEHDYQRNALVGTRIECLIDHSLRERYGQIVVSNASILNAADIPSCIWTKV